MLAVWPVRVPHSTVRPLGSVLAWSCASCTLCRVHGGRHGQRLLPRRPLCRARGRFYLADGHDCLLLDLDGTVFRGHAPTPGALGVLEHIGGRALFVTNNASRSAEEVAQHLRELGFAAAADDVVTSAQSAARMLAARLPAAARVLVVGTDALAAAIAIHNIPEGVAISVPLYHATGKRSKAFLYSFGSGLAEPLGAVAGYLILRPFIDDTTFGIVFAAVAGIMVFISIDQLLPAAREYGRPNLEIYGLMAGMMVMAASLVLFAM